MILVDTSVWIDHFRRRDLKLAGHLESDEVLMHPWVCGELACGNLESRKVVLSYLQALPFAKLAQDCEVLHLIEERNLWGKGLGWIDIHLLASALLTRCKFWTRDKRLASVALELELG